MANRVSAMNSRGLRSLRKDLGSQKFVYAGAEYFCVPNTLSRGSTLTSGGFEGIVDFSLFVLQSDFPAALTADMTTVSADDTGYTADNDYPAPPSAGSKVTFPAPPLPGREYRVFKRSNPGADAAYEFVLASPNR
jgi:hypothetical protein